MRFSIGTALLGLTLAFPAAMAAAAPADVAVAPPCTDSSKACLEKIARLYIDALVSHDGAKLPLAPSVRRSENGLNNAKSAYEVRESFVRTNMVEGTRDVRFWTDPARGEVVTFFLLDVDLKAADALSTTRSGNTEYKVATTVPEGTYTVHESERFRIVKGYITEIEIIAHVENGKGLGSGWPVERDAVVKPK